MSQSQLFMAPYLTLKTLSTKIHFLFRRRKRRKKKPFLDRSQTYYSGAKKRRETSGSQKRGSFIVIHWLVQNARQRKGPDINSRRCPHEGRVYVGIMAFVRTQLNCLKGGLTQSIKLSEIVRKFQKPYGLQTFASFLCGGTHLSQYCCLRGTGPAPLWLVPSGNAAHLSPLFMLYAQNYGPVPQNKKGL